MVAMACAICGGSAFTHGSFTNRREITIPGGRRVHFGCLPRWLVADALARAFPGAGTRELEVLAARLHLAADDLPTGLRLLDRVARRMGWTQPGRASQVQDAAMRRFQRFVRDADTHVAPSRRVLSFVGLGDGSPEFRAADAEEVLAKEFGS